MLSTDLLLRREVFMSGEQSSERTFIEALFAQHHAEIFGFLVHMVHDEELAADLAQETFVKAFRAIGTLEDPARARGWLFQIASRTALDELRRRRVIRFVPWSGESRGVAPSAEETALHGTVSGELERALARIPARQRSALLLAEVQELSGVELASALGVSHVAARALLTRARESLRQALAEQRSSRAGASGQRTGRGRRAVGRGDTPGRRGTDRGAAGSASRDPVGAAPARDDAAGPAVSGVSAADAARLTDEGARGADQVPPADPGSRSLGTVGQAEAESRLLGTVQQAELGSRALGTVQQAEEP